MFKHQSDSRTARLEWYAGMALSGLLANPKHTDASCEALGRLAVELATDVDQALEKELKERQLEVEPAIRTSV
jgi:hypothetical protein